MNQLEAFRRLSDDSRFRDWVTAERDSAIKYLVAATDMAVVHRAQGQVQLLDKILECMEKAKSLR